MIRKCLRAGILFYYGIIFDLTTRNAEVEEVEEELGDISSHAKGLEEEMHWPASYVYRKQKEKLETYVQTYMKKHNLL